MISKITNTGVNAINMQKTAPAFKAEEAKVVTVPQANLNGTEALGNYNAGLILKKPEPLKVVTPIINIPDDIEDIEGERIYKSNGDLHSIVQDKGDTKVIIYPDILDDDKVKLVALIDKKTNMVIKEQNPHTYDGGTEVVEFHSRDRRNNVSAYYDKDGKLVRQSSETVDRNGVTKYVDYDVEDKRYSYHNTDKNGNYQEVSHNKDMSLIRYNTGKIVKDGELRQEVTFYNGSPVNIETRKNQPIPTLHSAFLQKNPELKPANRMISSRNDKDVIHYEGEKTYYSNGKVESNTIQIEDLTVTVGFDPDGNIRYMEGDNRSVHFEPDGRQTIIENLDNGAERVSTYYSNGNTRVRYSKDGDFKEICYNSKGKIEDYCYGNDDKHEYTCLEFNKQGYITSVWG